MKKLLQIVDKVISKASTYCIYYFSSKIDYDLLWREVAIKLGNIDPSNIIEYQRTITLTDVLIIKIKVECLNKKLICKIPLTTDSHRKLKANYSSLVKLNAIESDLIPKPIGEIMISKYNIFIETCIEGYNGYDIYLNGKEDGNSLLERCKQALFDIRGNIFSQIKPPTVISNKVLFLQLQEMFMESMPSTIPFNLHEIFHKINLMWKIKEIQCGLSHGDFWFGNIILSYNTEIKVEAIIDWDRLDLNTPMLFDEIHLETYYLAMKENESVGREIINCIRSSKYGLEDALIYWLLFILRSSSNNSKFISQKRWLKRNVLDMLGFLEQL